MSQYQLDKLELVNPKDVLRIMKNDVNQVSTTPDKYLKDNELTYYTLCNTWLLLIKDYSDFGWLAIAETITKYGLLYAIKEAQEAAEQLIKEQVVDSVLWRNIYKDVQRVGYNPRVPHVSTDRRVGYDPFATMLMLLRYPKRFSPLWADKIQQESLDDFVAVENRSKLLQRKEMSCFLKDILKEEASHYLNWDALCDEIECSLANAAMSFSSGVGADSSARLGDKLMKVAETLPEYFPQPFGIPYLGVVPTQPWACDVEGLNLLQRNVRVAAVPKSYKAARIIAMENTTRQALANAIGKIISKYLPKSFPLHNQCVNQQLAKYGSVYNSLATIDMSHASDTITKTHFRELFPRRFVELIDWLLGTHTVIKDKVRPMQQMSTSGHSLTFILEGMFFDIVDRSGTHLHERMSGTKFPKYVECDEETFLIPSVYGDDQVIWSEAAGAIIDILTALGLVVNESKSYIDGPYRESCGEEYWRGECVSSYYYPRFPICGSVGNISNRMFRDSYKDVYVDSMTSLVSLQQKLYGISYSASYFLLQVISTAAPKMTISEEGDSHENPYGYCSTYKERILSRYGILKVFDKWNTVLSTKFFRIEEDPSMELDDARKRYYKYLPGVRYKIKKPLSDVHKRVFDLYRYRDFLEHGPRYSDPLLKLLHVSDAPMSLEQAFGDPEIFWSFKETLDK